jgi:carbonic anhydrase/acetyltransferase-like protein (isoleucine patch superfamily)
MIGAGALVPPNMEVPSRTLVVGVPAKVKRELTEGEVQHIRQSAQNYIRYVENYRKSGVRNVNTR